MRARSLASVEAPAAERLALAPDLAPERALLAPERESDANVRLELECNLFFGDDEDFRAIRLTLNANERKWEH